MHSIVILFALITIAVSTSKYDYMQQTANNYEYKEPKYEFVPYGFGYEIVDEHGNKNWRREESKAENQVIGSYGFQDPNGISRQVEYMADKNGFRAQIKTTEPGTAPKNPADVSMVANPIQLKQQNYQKIAPNNNLNYGEKY